MSDEQLEAYKAFLTAKAYQSYVIQRRASKNITATLKESRPMLEITPQDLDANPFLLCTPDATYDLRLGMAGARAHSPEDFILRPLPFLPVSAVSRSGSIAWILFSAVTGDSSTLCR